MELEDLMNESIENLEKEFYSKQFQFSYSSINKLLWNPVVFHQLYILGMKEERQDSHLVQGKIIHALLLEPEKFEQNFVVSPDNLPSGNPRTVIDRVFAHHQELAKHGDERTMLAEFADAVLDVMKDMNYHQNLKTDQQRLDKIFIPDIINYWHFLRTKGNKTLIDQESLEFCMNAVELIKINPEICKLIGCNSTEFDNIQIFNELPLSCSIENKSFGLKGIIDNLVIDHDQKILYINDVKTTSKDLKDFPETVEFYSYWMQAVIYCTLVSINFQNYVLSGYTTKFHFVVVDKNLQTYAFPVRESTLVDWMDRLSKVLEKVEWHYVNNNYDLPYDFATKSIVL